MNSQHAEVFQHHKLNQILTAEIGHILSIYIQCRLYITALLPDPENFTEELWDKQTIHNMRVLFHPS